MKGEKKLTRSPKFLRMPEHKCHKCSASGKKGLLSSYKCLCEQIGANLTRILAENLQKCILGPKAPGYNE